MKRLLALATLAITTMTALPTKAITETEAQFNDATIQLMLSSNVKPSNHQKEEMLTEGYKYCERMNNGEGAGKIIYKIKHMHDNDFISMRSAKKQKVYEGSVFIMSAKYLCPQHKEAVLDVINPLR